MQLLWYENSRKFLSIGIIQIFVYFCILCALAIAGQNTQSDWRYKQNKTFDKGQALFIPGTAWWLDNKDQNTFNISVYLYTFSLFVGTTSHNYAETRWNHYSWTVQLVHWVHSLNGIN